MKLLFILKSGANITIDMPPHIDFSFGVMIKAMRADGYLQTDEAHIKYDECTAIMWQRDNGPPVNIQGLNA